MVYKNKKTGSTIETEIEMGGNWELVSKMDSEKSKVPARKGTGQKGGKKK